MSCNFCPENIFYAHCRSEHQNPLHKPLDRQTTSYEHVLRTSQLLSLYNNTELEALQEECNTLAAARRTHTQRDSVTPSGTTPSLAKLWRR